MWKTEMAWFYFQTRDLSIQYNIIQIEKTIFIAWFKIIVKNKWASWKYNNSRNATALTWAFLPAITIFCMGLLPSWICERNLEQRCLADWWKWRTSRWRIMLQDWHECQNVSKHGRLNRCSQWAFPTSLFAAFLLLIFLFGVAGGRAGGWG